MVQTRKQWVAEAINKINADYNRSSDTHLIKLDLSALKGCDLYLKDESTHPTGSLKHRLARSLFLYGLCNGHIGPDTPIIESSSGSTAISEAYFARLLGLRFIAVVPQNLVKEKIRQIEFYNGECFQVCPTDIYSKARQLAKDLSGHYMDQFTFAERATDWRGNNNIAESIFQQMQKERFPIPRWVVMSPGTGGTSATIGRYIRLHPDYHLLTELAVADPENSVFYDYFQTGDNSITCDKGSRIEGIGRPRVEPSFLPSVIDTMLKVSDSASIATIRWLEKVLGRKYGGSTGTNVFAALTLIQSMQENGEQGSVVTLICDSGERYLNTYYNDEWVEQQGLNICEYDAFLNQFSD
ncbi:PLP-dependent cysteine synthase family protein [Alteromonas sp. a30]|uniref:PLP-dependent cysteine synthase family protein n=1 Tax=Alteromonas sp. a30 TaxID=2730917 RepID=UPI00227EECFA|nr:PLP-dependent cysteine synthase family protein [Alteromonas sp. a30]MCY7295626.1 PLP-dependent cysteine synthase family protein [Alteromonas sp. a30]